jgi:hypothetical protein
LNRNACLLELNWLSLPAAANAALMSAVDMLGSNTVTFGPKSGLVSDVPLAYAGTALDAAIASPATASA